MNKTSLTFAGILLAAFVVPAAVNAAPPVNGAQVSPSQATQTPGLQPAIPACEVVLDGMIADWKKPNMKQEVAATSALIVGESAAAEGAKSGGGGFYSVGGKAVPSGAMIKGTGSLGALPTNEVYPATFEIWKNPSTGKAMMKWTYRGNSYQSVVDTCSSGYWTAASATSSFMVKMGKVVENPPPPR